MPDIARFTLSLAAAEGTPATEPNCYVGFKRTDDSTTREAKSVVFPPDRTFLLPAWPQEQNLYCLIQPSLYQTIKSNFFLPRGDTSQSVTALRLPSQWLPAFDALADLPPPRFAPFLQVVGNSIQVDVKHGAVLGRLDAAYDNLAGSQQKLAKMALLNLYAVLSDEAEPIGNTHWFRFVQQFVRIDQERFVAEADQELFNIVKNILDNLDTFKSKGFFTESASLHLENIPERYTLTSDLITVKVRYEQGNVQFTMATAQAAGKNVALLDCDMDEHSNIIAHTGDLFTHVFTGGTHPVDMHEYIVHHDPGVDLGYNLNPARAATVAGAAVGAGT
jgi:hypothetical protein